MSLARKILGNTVAQIFGRFATALLAVITVKILTSVLGASGYGQYVFIYEILAFAGAFADFGIFTIALREMSRHPERETTIFGNAVSLRIVSTTVFLSALAIGIFFIPKYSGTVIPIGVAIAAVATFFVILSGTFSAALQTRMKMHLAATALVIGKIISVFLIFLVATRFFPSEEKMPFYFLIIAGAIGAFLTFAITAFLTKQVFPVGFRWDFQEIKKIAREAAPFGLALALNVAYLKLDVILISALLPTEIGNTQNGFYGVAVRIADILLMIPIYFMNSVLPTLSERLEKKDRSVDSLLQNAFLFLFAVSVAGGILLFLLARPIAAFISSPEFLSTATSPGSDTALRILSGFFPIAFLSMFFGFLLIATGRQAFLIIINSAALSANFLGNLWAIPHFGFVGAASVSVVSELVMFCLMIFFSRKFLRFSFHFPQMLGVLFAGFVAGIFCFFARDFFAIFGNIAAILGVGILFFLIFFGILWKGRILTPEILSRLKK